VFPGTGITKVEVLLILIENNLWYNIGVGLNVGGGSTVPAPDPRMAPFLVEDEVAKSLSYPAFLCQLHRQILA